MGPKTCRPIHAARVPDADDGRHRSRGRCCRRPNGNDYLSAMAKRVAVDVPVGARRPAPAAGDPHCRAKPRNQAAQQGAVEFAGEAGAADDQTGLAPVPRGPTGRTVRREPRRAQGPKGDSSGMSPGQERRRSLRPRKAVATAAGSSTRRDWSPTVQRIAWTGIPLDGTHVLVASARSARWVCFEGKA